LVNSVGAGYLLLKSASMRSLPAPAGKLPTLHQHGGGTWVARANTVPVSFREILMLVQAPTESSGDGHG
jgi:hypothetical protein